MNYDLAVWEGPRPADHDEAARHCDAALKAMEAEQRQPTAAMGAFISALLSVWPDQDSESDDCAWAEAPLLPRSVSGSAAYLSMKRDLGKTKVAPDVIRLASQHGLNVFDPQIEELVS